MYPAAVVGDAGLLEHHGRNRINLQHMHACDGLRFEHLLKLQACQGQLLLPPIPWGESSLNLAPPRDA